MSSGPQKVETRVVEEQGRWVVYLEVTFWEDDQEFPLKTVKHRVQDYPTKKRAEMAAEIYRRAADRDMEGPSFGL